MILLPFCLVIELLFGVCENAFKKFVNCGYLDIFYINCFMIYNILHIFEIL